MKIRKISRQKAGEVFMLFPAMVLSLNMITARFIADSMSYTIIMIFACLTLADAVMARRVTKAKKNQFIKLVGRSIIFFAGAVSVIIADEPYIIDCYYFFYGLSLLYARVISGFRKLSPINIVWNLVFAALSGILMLTPFVAEEEVMSTAYRQYRTTPVRQSCADSTSLSRSFSSDCLNSTQAGCHQPRRIWAI